jgi:hypothetical protein
MKNINNEVFLNKITQKIQNGAFDTHLTLPLMTRELLFLSIKGRIDKKIDTGATPILNDAEIKDCLSEVKETAANMIHLYLKLGFIERTEEGFSFTEKWNLALRAAYK